MKGETGDGVMENTGRLNSRCRGPRKEGTWKHPGQSKEHCECLEIRI